MKPTPLFTFLLFLAVAACGTGQIPTNCCKDEMEILTENYNRDSVFIYLPNAITPNYDAINDIFTINCAGVTYAKLKIFKSGRKIFETEGERPEWDGLRNKKAKPGSYRYEATLTTIHNEQVEIKGKVCVILINDRLKTTICNPKECTFASMIHRERGFIYESQEMIVSSERCFD